MKVTVIGLGYVGLPVACAFAKARVKVNGIDKNEKLIESLKSRSYSYTEPFLNETLNDVLDKTLFVSDKITEADVYIVTVQTPVDAYYKSDNSYVEKALSELSPHIKEGNLIILESTVPVGSNEVFYKILRENVSENINFSYCYCPESILPGNIFAEIRENPRIIGGKTESAAKEAEKVYNLINTSEKVLTDILTAEFAKLVQNAHRDVELAFVNQLSMMCDREGVDPFHLIEVTNSHPRCNLLQPGSGVGGHCIAIDPYFLIERYGDGASLMRTARQVNNYKPVWVAQKAISLLENNSGIVGILGLSYKANCDDCRESSGTAICNYLKESGITVLANEINSPFKEISGIENTPVDDVIKNSDVLIIAQKHSAYIGLDLSGKKVINCVNLPLKGD